MSLRMYNTLSGKIEELAESRPLENPNTYGAITIYSCGPTVYGFSHIGNFRTFIFNDLLKRYLRFKGFNVVHAMNITDVDDKTIAGAAAEDISLKEYTDRYAQFFLEDMQTLNIEPPDHIPKATEAISDITDIIKRLDEKGLIYQKEGSIYFSIGKWDRYGRLSKLDKREIKTGLRYDTDEYDKDDIRDFALWKAAKAGEPSWDTPYGKGRPGWHIECSAMIHKIFKTTIDIHTGGVDLIFPHHENEIAQSEAAYDIPFVRFWLHAEHLLVNGSKMSKSKGNFYTLRDLLSLGYSPRSVRYLLLSAHYRRQLNFTLEGIKQAEQALERIDNFLLRLESISDKAEEKSRTVSAKINEFLADFSDALDNDLNISGGLGVFFDFIRDINSLIDRELISRTDAEELIYLLRKIDSVFGFIFFKPQEASRSNIETVRIEALIKERAEAKRAKDFARSDAIREELLAEGIILEDTKDGTRWKKKI